MKQTFSLFQIANFLGHFTRTFNDLLIILLSTALALRFKQVNQRLLVFGKATHSLRFWIEIRKDYIRLCRLCKLVNECIALQILLSFGNNFWYILLKIFQSIRQVLLHNREKYIFKSFLQISQLHRSVVLATSFHHIHNNLHVSLCSVGERWEQETCNYTQQRTNSELQCWSIMHTCSRFSLVTVLILD